MIGHCERNAVERSNLSLDRRGRGAPGAPLAGGKDSGFPCVQRFLANPFMDGEQQKCPLYPRSARNTTSLLLANLFMDGVPKVLPIPPAPLCLFLDEIASLRSQ